MSRWRLRVRGLVLRTAWLFLGAAIGLAAILLAVSLAAVLDPYVPGDGWTLYPVCLAPFALLGLLPGVRDLEVTAARAMLGVTAELVVPSEPTAQHRTRSAVWAVLHLVLGLAAAVALVGVVPGAVAIAVSGVRHEPVTVGGWDLPVTTAVGALALGLALAAAAGLLARGLGLLAARAAPAFLGPTAQDRLELAEVRLAAEAEHTRLARDLHDGIGHALTIIVVQAAAGRRVLAQEPATAARALGGVEDTARDALAELDAMLAVLRDPGERPGPEPGVDRLPVLVDAHRAAGLAVDADLGDLGPLSPVLSGTVYRVVAEGLANAQQHAGAGPVTLRVAGAPGAVSVVVDNPRPVATRGRVSGGRGLVGVRERVAVLGGTVEAGPQDGVWRLRAVIPVPSRSTGRPG